MGRAWDQATSGEREAQNNSFWGGVTNWWNDITGKTQKDQAAATTAAGQKTSDTGAQGVAAGQNTMGAAANTAGQLAGVSGTQSAAEAGKAGAALGEQMGQQNATAATQNAARSARTSGLNAGQAAQLGGQAAGQAFTQGQQTGQQLGMNAYDQGANRQLNAVGTQGSIGQGQAGVGVAQQGVGVNQINAGTQQQAQGQQQNKDFWGGITSLATSALGLSDENAKTDIKDAKTLDKAAENVDSKTFKYKKGDGGKETGVIAQDLEKVVPENVVETPAGKAVDTRKQTLSNTAWLMEAAKRIRELEKKVG